MRASIFPPTHWETPYKHNRTRKITAQEFDIHKRAITQLYITEDLELDEVRRIMTQRYKFYGSEPQYKKRLRLWRLEKKIPKRKILHLLRKMDQRLAEGKKTECIFNGQVVSIEKLERSRHRFKGELAEEPASPAPSTLSNAECRTPLPGITLASPASTRMEIQVPDTQQLPTPPVQTQDPTSAVKKQPFELSRTQPQPQIGLELAPGALQAEAVELLDEGRYASAMECLNPVLLRLENVFTRENEQPQDWNSDLADTTGNMGLVYSGQGQYTKALEFTERALSHFEKSGNYRHTAGALNNLGVIYDRQGDCAKAMEFHKRALAGYEKSTATATTNNADLDMIKTLNNMGIVFRKQGHYIKALEHHTRALAGSRKAGDRRGCATSLNNIGVVFFTQRNYNAAWEFYNRSLAHYESTIFGDNPDMLATLHNIGLLFDSLKLYHEALPYYQRALRGYGKTYGDNSHVTLGTLLNLGNVLFNLRDYEKTVEIVARELAARKKVLGRNHSETVKAQHRLAEAKATLSRQQKGGDVEMMVVSS